MATYPIVRISKGHFTSVQYDEVRRLIYEPLWTIQASELESIIGSPNSPQE